MKIFHFPTKMGKLISNEGCVHLWERCFILCKNKSLSIKSGLVTSTYTIVTLKKLMNLIFVYELYF